MTMSINMNTVHTTVNEAPTTLAGTAHFDATTGEVGGQWTMELIQAAAALTAETVDGIGVAADDARKLYEADQRLGAEQHTELGSLALDPKATLEDIRAKQTAADQTLGRLREAQKTGLDGFRSANQALAALAVAADEGFTTSQTPGKLGVLEAAAESFIRPHTDGLRTLRDVSNSQKRGFPRLDVAVLRANAQREDF